MRTHHLTSNLVVIGLGRDARTWETARTVAAIQRIYLNLLALLLSQMLAWSKSL